MIYLDAVNSFHSFSFYPTNWLRYVCRVILHQEQHLLSEPYSFYPDNKEKHSTVIHILYKRKKKLILLYSVWGKINVLPPMFSKWNEIMLIVTSSVIGFYGMVHCDVMTESKNLSSHLAPSVAYPKKAIYLYTCIYENYPEWSDTVL